MGNDDKSCKRDVTEKGRIKGTSAFDIKQAKELREISWSNNNSASAHVEAEKPYEGWS